MDPTPEPGRWLLYAGRRTAVEGDEVFTAIGNDPRFAISHGHRAETVVPVEAVEDPDGRYWGWLRNLNWDRSLPPAYQDHPVLIQEHERLFRVSFPYSIESEEARNAGRLVRLTITAADVEATTPS